MCIFDLGMSCDSHLSVVFSYIPITCLKDIGKVEIKTTGGTSCDVLLTELT